MILTLATAASPEADEGTQVTSQPYPIKQQLYWASYILKQWTICLVCWITGSPYQQSYLPVLTVGQWQLANRNNCTTMLLNHNYEPGTNTLYESQNSSLGEATLRQIFQVTVTSLKGYHDLSEWTIPNPHWLPTQNSDIHWVDRLNSWLIGSYVMMTILHTPSIPALGIAYALLHQ